MISHEPLFIIENEKDIISLTTLFVPKYLTTTNSKITILNGLLLDQPNKRFSLYFGVCIYLLRLITYRSIAH